MISGSQASIYYGEPRFSQDIDVVVKKDTPYDRVECERRERHPIAPVQNALFSGRRL